MPRITRVYTRTGDDGSTALGGGRRVPKSSLRVAAYGTVDELSSCLGLALAAGLDDSLRLPLERIQNELFHLGADLCTTEDDKSVSPVPQIDEHHVGALEQLMDELSEELEPLANFVLPGGSHGGAHLHVARTVCRRAERLVVDLAESEPIGTWVLQYLNRLSDALFVMARFENKAKNVEDILWDSRS